MTFVRQEAVRCPDCDIRGDLHATGYPLKEAKGHIRVCTGCGGSASLPAPGPDPYTTKVDSADVYARRRAERAAAARITYAPRPLRRRFLDRARIEALMTEES